MEKVLERLKELMEKEEVSPSTLADTVGISRPLLSHVLSGRNKPSLQLVFKVLEKYPSYSADWLLFGKENNTTSQLKAEKPEPATISPIKKTVSIKNTPDVSSAFEVKNDDIEKILVFYRNKTFDVYKPQ